MRTEDWETVRAAYKPWQEADLHDLRMRFAAVLLSIREHERKSLDSGRDMSAADIQLWSIPKEEGF